MNKTEETLSTRPNKKHWLGSTPTTVLVSSIGLCVLPLFFWFLLAYEGDRFVRTGLAICTFLLMVFTHINLRRLMKLRTNRKAVQEFRNEIPTFNEYRSEPYFERALGNAIRVAPVSITQAPEESSIELPEMRTPQNFNGARPLK